jgi:hypothetical protein
LIKIDIDNEDLDDMIDDKYVIRFPYLIYSKGGRKVYRRSGFADDATLKML